MNLYTITKENRLSLCDEISELVGEFCEDYCREKRDILKYRLSVEESLINWLTEDSIGHTVTLECSKKLFSLPFIKLTYDGEKLNPFSEKEYRGIYAESTLLALGLTPEYKYQSDKNILQFNLPSTRKSSAGFFLAIIAAAVFVGLVGKLMLPASLIDTLNSILLQPLYDAFLDILNLVAGPMLLLSVAWGIYGIGDTMSFSNIGKSLIVSYLRTTMLVSLLGLLLIPLFNLNITGGGVISSQLGEITELIFGCIPNNIVDPFSTGNTLQIIFLAFILGISLLYLGKKTESVARAVEQINILLQFIMNFITKLVPWLMFVIIVILFWNGSFEIIGTSWRFYLILIGACLVGCICFLLLTAAKYRLSPIKLFKTISPSVLIALLTGSSAATFESNTKICTKKLGVDKSVASFGIPLGMVMHNPMVALNNIVFVFFFAEAYGVECSPVWFVTAVLCCGMLAIAAPPIPGGGILVYAMLFSQFGIPAEGVVIVVALDMIADFIVTGAEVLCLLPGLVLASDRVGMLDRSKLSKLK